MTNLDELEALERKAPPVETVEECFLLIHKVATRQSDRSYMSVPADPKRDADLIVGGALEHYAALRNEAVPMIQELRALRAEVEGLKREAKVAHDAASAAIAPKEAAEAELAALRAELASISAEFGLPPKIRPAEGEIARFMAERKRAHAENEQLRAEVEGLKAANTKAVAHATEEETLKWEAITREGERQSVIDSLRAQLATAREDALEEAALEASEHMAHACRAAGMTSGECVAESIRALKKTKGAAK